MAKMPPDPNTNPTHVSSEDVPQDEPATSSPKAEIFRAKLIDVLGPEAEVMGFVPSRADIRRVSDVPDELHQAADRIIGSHIRTLNEIYKTGRELCMAKEKVPHGKFTEWVTDECGMDMRTAERYMTVAAKFFGNVERLKGLTITSVYDLSAPGTPQSARDEILSRADQGEQFRTKDVRQAIREHKVPEAERKARDKKAKASARARARRDERESEKRQAEQEEIQRRRAAENDASERLADIIVDVSGDRRDDLLDLLPLAHQRIGEKLMARFRDQLTDRRLAVILAEFESDEPPSGGEPGEDPSSE